MGPNGPTAGSCGFYEFMHRESAFVSISTAAVAFGISESTCLRRVQRGEVQAVSDAGRWKVLASELPSRPQPTSPSLDGAESARSVLVRRLAELPPLVGPEVVAEITGLGITAVRRAIRNGDIPSRRVGSRRLVPVLLLGEWLGVAA